MSQILVVKFGTYRDEKTFNTENTLSEFRKYIKTQKKYKAVCSINHFEKYGIIYVISVFTDSLCIANTYLSHNTVVN